MKKVGEGRAAQLGHLSSWQFGSGHPARFGTDSSCLRINKMVRFKEQRVHVPGVMLQSLLECFAGKFWLTAGECPSQSVMHFRMKWQQFFGAAKFFGSQLVVVLGESQFPAGQVDFYVVGETSLHRFEENVEYGDKSQKRTGLEDTQAQQAAGIQRSPDLILGSF